MNPMMEYVFLFFLLLAWCLLSLHLYLHIGIRWGKVMADVVDYVFTMAMVLWLSWISHPGIAIGITVSWGLSNLSKAYRKKLSGILEQTKKEMNDVDGEDG